DPAAVAKSFLDQNSLASGSGCTGSIKVGTSYGGTESKIAQQMYGQALQAAGCTVTYQVLASRTVSDAALFGGQIDVKPEYLASESTALDASAKVSGDSNNNLTILR